MANQGSKGRSFQNFVVGHLAVTLGHVDHCRTFAILANAGHPGEIIIASGPVNRTMAGQLRALADQIDCNLGDIPDEKR